MKKIIITIIITIVLLNIIVFCTNQYRINKNIPPILYLTVKEANDGGSKIYNFIFYKIIGYRNIYNKNVIYITGNPFVEFNNPYYKYDNK